MQPQAVEFLYMAGPVSTADLVHIATQAHFQPLLIPTLNQYPTSPTRNRQNSNMIHLLIRPFLH